MILYVLWMGVTRTVSPIRAILSSSIFLDLFRKVSSLVIEGREESSSQDDLNKGRHGGRMAIKY
jgi:hypothetical protein